MAKDTKSKRPVPRPDPRSALVRAFGQNMTASRYFGLDEDGNSTKGVRGQIRPTERPSTTEDRANRRKAGGKIESEKMATRPTPRPSRAPATSKKPTPRPSTAEERAAGERGDRAARRDAGMKAGGKVKKMAMGGKCRGMGAATKGGNFSRG